MFETEYSPPKNVLTIAFKVLQTLQYKMKTEWLNFVTNKAPYASKYM